MVLFDFNLWGDIICNFCIDFMKAAVNVFGVSYGLINVLLFVVLGPTSTIAFMIAWIMEKLKKKKTSKVLFIIGLIEVIFVVGAIAYVALLFGLDIMCFVTSTREMDSLEIEQTLKEWNGIGTN